MIVRLAVVITLVAMFALSFSALVDMSRQRSFAAQATGGDCLADRLLCAPGAGSRD